MKRITHDFAGLTPQEVEDKLWAPVKPDAEPVQMEVMQQQERHSYDSVVGVPMLQGRATAAPRRDGMKMQTNGQPGIPAL